ncbi:MAG: FAD-binding oxidoreductase [Propionibacteriales bacterium]|nr:FAD-binding oxidoreductase [Propionibacteriales bacterium]
MSAEFRGSVITPSDAGYDEARSVFNGLIDHKPERIMRCVDAADVAAAIAGAREAELTISVYGGGHGVTGSAVVDGGVCVDLRAIDHVVVDPATRTARVGGGASWGSVDAATQEHGLAVTGGRVSTTGVGGLSLGSGSGWLERAFGFTCDSLVSAEVVTAASEIVTASEESHPDLFWAIRGGGGNFGVVTEFTFDLHPLGPMMLGGMLLYPGFMAKDVLRNWRDFILGAPREVGGGVALITAPPEEFVPEAARGMPAVGVIITYAGDPEEGARVVAPLTSFGPPAANLVQPMPYVAVQQLLDAPNPKGMHNYWSGDFLTEFPDEAIDAFVDNVQPPVSPLTQMIVIPGGGAISDRTDADMAFGNRTAPFNMHYLSMWPPDPTQDQVNIDKTRQIAAALKPWTTGQVYLNFIGDEGVTRVESAYGSERFARLREIKKAWDPDNVFRHNQNIPPAD